MKFDVMRDLPAEGRGPEPVCVGCVDAETADDALVLARRTIPMGGGRKYYAELAVAEDPEEPTLDEVLGAPDPISSMGATDPSALPRPPIVPSVHPDPVVGAMVAHASGLPPGELAEFLSLILHAIELGTTVVDAIRELLEGAGE